MTIAISKIVSVNTADRGGGAEQVAWTLFKGFERRGIESWLVVGDKKTEDPRVLPFYLSPHVDYRPYAKSQLQNELAEAKRRDLEQGIEDFHFPYSKYLPSITGSRPDVILCHNLHGGYFDLRVLPDLSRQVPTFLVLHDAWTMTGHCAHSFDCSRWQTGCGQCPDLTITPAIQQDASNFNWSRKQDIYARSHLFVAAPTQWLLDLARQSILAPAIRDSRLIPCPVNTRQFHPVPRRQVRQELGLPEDAFVLVFAAYQAKTNPFKDCATIEAAVERLAHHMPDVPILFIGLGEEAPEREFGRTRLVFLPFQTQPNMIRYLQAADVYVHAAKAENAGLVTAEAQACGTPVVATAVGGLPETVQDGKCGLLVPPGDAEAMARAIGRLLSDSALRNRLGEQAARHARECWDSEKIEDSYLGWFAESRRTFSSLLQKAA